jgi:hypothetical protein
MGKHSGTGWLSSMLRRRSGNQVRHEPMPASAHAEQRQDSVLRNAELGSASAARDDDHQAWPAQGSEEGGAGAGG